MSKIMDKVSVAATKTKDWIRFRSPEILMVVGGISILAGVVWACKESMTIEDKVNKLKEDLEIIDRAEEIPTETDIEDSDGAKVLISSEEAKELRRKTYLKYGWMMTKGYMPAAGLIIGGLGCFLYSHHIMTNRYAVLSSAYASLDGAFKAYREKITEKLGEDEEKKLFREVMTKESSNECTDLIVSSPYTFIWDSASKHWCEDGAENFRTLQDIQAIMNNIFQMRGYVFLNEVLHELDLPETEAGSICGWLKGNGDEYIDFGIWSDDNHRFLAGDENVALLNFNCDGVIFNKIWAANVHRSGGLHDIADF